MPVEMSIFVAFLLGAAVAWLFLWIGNKSQGIVPRPPFVPNPIRKAPDPPKTDEDEKPRPMPFPGATMQPPPEGAKG